MTFDEIMAPLGAELFLREYLGRQPLHLQASPDKFHEVMNWDVLNRLLGMTTIWSTQSLVLVMDKEPIPPAAYASPAAGRDGGTVLRPDPVRVAQLLARGVSWYSKFSKGQLPAIFTPYRTAASWGGNRFDNAKLKSLGWKPIVPTNEGIARTLEWLKANPKK